MRPRAVRSSGNKLRPFLLRDLCALVREISAPCLSSLGPGTGNSHGETKRTESCGNGAEESPESFRPGQTVQFFIRLQTTKNKERMPKAK
jgi:hypothetical protein